jgi:hypothetical protein
MCDVVKDENEFDLDRKCCKICLEKAKQYELQKYKSMKEGQRKKIYANRKRRHEKFRKDALDKLGGKCVICGFSDYRALQIDHIDGNGQTDRKNLSHLGFGTLKYFSYIVEHPDKYQVLCANCNWIKRYEKNETRGKSKTLHVDLISQKQIELWEQLNYPD